ncbi:hypothetical protein FUAX_18900 [Fulvitalea axinellae]|uniref:Uncharacterized protein n=1 Tax=Fulvitalea axinellae TaxID=1182444 RepID=A0AAU9D0N0_9BACT|nr:hypothetical protein FUAX_18900 [Fulvitalea axinellae]
MFYQRKRRADNNKSAASEREGKSDSIQAMFSSKDREDLSIAYTGHKLTMQTSFMSTLTVKGKEYRIIENGKGEITGEKSVFLIADDMSLAVLNVSGKFRPKFFFAHPEVILRTNTRLEAQKARVYLKETGNQLLLGEQSLCEVEVMPDEEGAVDEVSKRQMRFPNMPLRGGSSNPTRYMFGYTDLIEHPTDFGVRFAPPFGILAPVDSPISSDLKGIEGDVVGVRGLVDVLLDPEAESLNDASLRERLLNDIDRDQRTLDDNQYKKYYTTERERMRGMERRLGVNQFAQPRLGDSVATFMRSNADEDMGMFEQGNYHGGVVAESLDGRDYVTLEMRRRMDLENEQRRHYFHKAGIDVSSMSDFHILHHGAPLMAETERGMEVYQEYIEAKKYNVLPHQTAFYRMYGRSEEQSYHALQKGPYFGVPAPLTVVFSATDIPGTHSLQDSAREESLSPSPTGSLLELPPLPVPSPSEIPSDDEDPFWSDPFTRPKLSSTSVGASIRISVLEATLNLEVDTYEGKVTIKSFRDLFVGDVGAEAYKDKGLDGIKYHLNHYQSLDKIAPSRATGAMLQERLSLLMSLQKSIFAWYGSFDGMKKNKELLAKGDKRRYYALLSPVLRFLDFVSDEMDAIIEAMRHRSVGLPVFDSEADVEIQELWRALGNGGKFMNKLTPPQRRRLQTYFAQLIWAPHGRKLLKQTLVQPAGNHKVSLVDPKKKAYSADFVTTPNSAKGRPKASRVPGEVRPGAGTESKVVFPDSMSLSEVMVLGEGGGVSVLHPGFIRFAYALEQARRAQRGLFGDDDASKMDMIDQQENLIRMENGLPLRVGTQTTTWHDILMPPLKTATGGRPELEDWQIVSLW